MNFLERFSKNSQISNFIKIHLKGAQLFHADGRTDRHDETNSRFSQFVNVPNNYVELVLTTKH